MKGRHFLRSFLVYFLVSLFVGSFAFYWRDKVIDFTLQFVEADGGDLGLLTTQQLFFTSLYSSTLLALFSSILDVFVFKSIFKKRSLGTTLLFTTFFQLIVIMLVILEVYNFVNYFIFGRDFTLFLVFEDLPDLFQVGVLMLIIIAVSRFLLEIDRKLGYGNLWLILSGQFYKPHEERRIFMFIDMKSSTSIAEKIGHFKFSQLIQDSFKDLFVIERYGAEVYQYVGDEVILSWKAHRGFKRNNYLKAFFAFKDQLESKRETYESKYGIFPIFKAGAHVGNCTVAEVGELKREICYHGDTLNTTARIEAKCNLLDSDLLVSEQLYKESNALEEFRAIDAGESELRGKMSKMKLFKIEKKKR